MEWLPSPLNFSTMFDCTVTEHALLNNNFKFLKWTQEQGYRITLFYIYQKVHYGLKDGKIKGDWEEERAQVTLDWMKLYMHSMYNLDGSSDKRNFPNPLRVDLQFETFYPATGRNPEYYRKPTDGRGKTYTC